MGKRITLEYINKMLRQWSATIGVYDDRSEEGMDHESGYDFSGMLVEHLADAELVVRKLTSVLMKVKAEKIAYKVGAPEFHELRFEADAAIAELEQP